MMVYTIHELVEYILIEQSPLLHATIQAGSSIRNKARSHFRVHHFTFPPISSFLVSHFLFPRSWFYQCPPLLHVASRTRAKARRRVCGKIPYSRTCSSAVLNQNAVSETDLLIARARGGVRKWMKFTKTAKTLQ